MRFSDLRTEILEDVYKNYPQFVFKNIEGKDDYLGCGCIYGVNHIDLTLICTLPLFNNLFQANSQLLEHFGWERSFQHHKLKNELSTPEKSLHFFSQVTKPDFYDKAQSFIFRPEQLVRVIDIVQKALPEKSQEEIVKDILKNSKSEAHKILFDLTVKKIIQEKDLIVSQNWKKAKAAFCRFRLLECIQLIWKNWNVKSDAKMLIQNLKKLDDNGIGDAEIGIDACGDDHII